MSSIFDFRGRDSSMPSLCSICLGMLACRVAVLSPETKTTHDPQGGLNSPQPNDGRIGARAHGGKLESLAYQSLQSIIKIVGQ